MSCVLPTWNQLPLTFLSLLQGVSLSPPNQSPVLHLHHHQTWDSERSEMGKQQPLSEKAKGKAGRPQPQTKPALEKLKGVQLLSLIFQKNKTGFRKAIICAHAKSLFMSRVFTPITTLTVPSSAHCEMPSQTAPKWPFLGQTQASAQTNRAANVRVPSTSPANAHFS